MAGFAACFPFDILQVDEFILGIDKARFHSTNELWNRYGLNDPWSVGYVSNLIKQKVFTTKEDWEDHYYRSGQERANRLSKLSAKHRETANDFLLKKNAPELLKSLPLHVKKANYDFGRTQKDLSLKAEFLQWKMLETNRRLTVEECWECVRFRVICETWNGIIIRERNVISRLKEMFPLIEFHEVTGEKDYQYAVDYELFLNGKHVGAIQIKPETYLNDSSYVQTARKANERKHADYERQFGKRVGVFIGDRDGKIRNTSALLKLSEFYKRKTA
jgi:hypothetical protein